MRTLVLLVILGLVPAAAHAEGPRPHHVLVDGFTGDRPYVFVEHLRPTGPAVDEARAITRHAHAVVTATPQAASHRASAVDAALRLRVEGDPALAGFARRGPEPSSLRGLLPTPVRDARPVAAFGTRNVRGIPGSERRHTGWSWEVDGNTQVHAVASGVVVFADRVEGLGGVVIVDHGDELHTVYAGLATVSVAVWEPVATGDVVARGGVSDRGGAAEVYFEIRERGLPADPSSWLAAGANVP